MCQLSIPIRWVQNGARRKANIFWIWFSYFSGAKFWIHVPCLRSVYHFLVHFRLGLSRYDYGIYCEVSTSAKRVIFVCSLLCSLTNEIVSFNKLFVSLTNHAFTCRGLRSKHLTRLEHQLADNIKATQSRIWNGVTKDVGYLRRILNEVYVMKFKVRKNCCIRLRLRDRMQN